VTNVDSLQDFNGVLYVGTETSNIGTVYTYTKTSGQSYALKFSSVLGNNASISFIGGQQVDGNSTNTGSFVFSNGMISGAGAYDVAEDYPTRDDSLQPGDLVSIDTGEVGFVRKSRGL